MKTRLIIDEDSVYEIDEECELQKREAQKQAENHWKKQDRTMKKQDKKFSDQVKGYRLCKWFSQSLNLTK